MNLWLIFLTGLTVGGLTCLALQGGLLASVIASRKEKTNSILPVTSFLISKLFAYIALGFILGGFGSALAISDSIRIIMQFAASIYMIVIALSLLNVHPIFRYAIIQPPKFLTRKIKDASRSKEIFAPFLLGIFTIFIPCGTTLAIEVLAISSGSAILGALTMAVFTLGTFPLFLILGFLASKLKNIFETKFLKLAGILVLYIGVVSLNGSLILVGSPVNLQTVADSIPFRIRLNLSGQNKQQQNLPAIVNGVQKVNISVNPTNYTPNYIQVRSGIPVELDLMTNGGLGCTSEFRIPSLGIATNLPQNGTSKVEFTPQKREKILFTCSMGMYTGIIDVM